MKKIFAIILLSFISLYSSAQDSTVQDSTQSIILNNAGISAPVDTTLHFNPPYISADSVDALKHSPSLAYLQDLGRLLKEEREEKLDDVKEKIQKEHSSWLSDFFNSSLTRDFFWILAGAFILFILYRLFLTEGIFQRQSASAKVKENVVTDEMPQHVSDYDPLIEKAIAAKDFRLAVRYLYLQTLQQLSDKGKIQLAPDKTNYQYLLELKDDQLRELFSSVTISYEYVWYGEFDINETSFGFVRGNFKKIMDQL